MSKIIRAVLPLQYTFTGNDRDADATQASDAALTLKQINGEKGAVAENLADCVSMKILRSRIVASGADGLKPGIGGLLAAEIALQFAGASNTSKVNLAFSDYGEWTENNFVLSLGNKMEARTASILQGSKISVDDSNIQDAYVGQSFTAVIEMEVESYSM